MDPFIDIRQIKAFLVLAKKGSFTKAGDELKLTQSAISHTIKSLETELQCQLFHRQGKLVYLTHYGREFLVHAETILQNMSLARRMLGSLDNTPRGKITIGSTLAASQFILPTVLREFKESFPQYEIKVVPGETLSILDKLYQDEIDVALTLEPEDLHRIDSVVVFSDTLEFLVSPLHPWAKQAPTAKEVLDETIIISSRASQNFTILQEHFLKLGVRLTQFMELGSTEAIKELAKLGLGVAVGGRWIAKQEIEAKQLVPIVMPKSEIKRRWIASSLKGRPLNLAERTFIGLCKEVGKLLRIKTRA
jgi:DNA-binding transcriptional LysR family regulator